MNQTSRPIISNTYAYSLQLTQPPGNLSPNLLKIEGYYQGAVQAWLMFFDSLGAPIDGTAPLYAESLGVVAPNGYSWQFNPGIIQRLNSALSSRPLAAGLIVCISTTANTLTLGTGSNSSTFYVSLEEWETLPTGNIQQTGDTTSIVNSITPWVDGAFHTIDKIIVNNSGASIHYLQLHTTLPVSGTTKPLQQWLLPVGMTLTELNFRGAGYIPQTVNETVTPPVVHNGCYLYLSSTPGVFTNLIDVGNQIQCNWV